MYLESQLIKKMSKGDRLVFASLFSLSIISSRVPGDFLLQSEKGFAKRVEMIYPIVGYK